MTPAFHKALSRTAEHEKGYSNHPSDPGGETMYGVTLRIARKWGYQGQMRFLPKDLAKEIFFHEYWTPIRGDEVEFALAYQLFDTAVHSGPPQTIRILQRVLGVAADGQYGPVTLAAARNFPDVFDLAGEFISARLEFLSKLPAWSVFGKGWSKRSTENALYLVFDARESLVAA